MCHGLKIIVAYLPKVKRPARDREHDQFGRSLPSVEASTRNDLSAHQT